MTATTAETWSFCNVKINLTFITLAIKLVCMQTVALDKLPLDPSITLAVKRPGTTVKPLILRITFFRS